MREFVKYDKVVRLGNKEADGILEGLVYVMPKLDGTNASIWAGPDGVPNAGSRNRELTVSEDNAGFHKFVTESESICDFFSFTQGRYRLYGEWLVPHTVKGYIDSAWRKFYVFDVWDEDDEVWLKPDEFTEILDIYDDIQTMPCIVLSNPNAEELQLSRDHLSGFLMDGGYGEGVVLKNYEWANRYGRSPHAKYLCEDFSVNKGQKVQVAMDHPVEAELATLITPSDLCLKTKAKIVLTEGGWSGKCIPRYLSTVWHDALIEELPDALKKMKLPTVNFKALQKEVYNIARSRVL